MNRLKELRQEKKLTQKELADKIGVHYRTLQNWENNKAEIKSDKAQKLADEFDVSVGYLLGYSDSKLINLKEIEDFINRNEENNPLNDFFRTQTIDILLSIDYQLDDFQPHIEDVYQNNLMKLPMYQGKSEEEHHQFKKNVLNNYIDGLGRFIPSDTIFFIKCLMLSKQDFKTVQSLVDRLLDK